MDKKQKKKPKDEEENKPFEFLSDELYSSLLEIEQEQQEQQEGEHIHNINAHVARSSCCGKWKPSALPCNGSVFLLI